MAIKNYYTILGVAQNETPSGIRAAYHDAVRRTHPDYAGPQSAPDFQAVVEANSVLSDPERRREYNRRLGLQERDQNQTGMLRNLDFDWQPQSIFADMHAVHPSFEALADRLLRNFTGIGIPKAERPEPLSIEIILTPEEAARGGILSLGIPTHDYCDVCGGTGRDWLFPCHACAGEGIVSRVRPLQVRIPQSFSLGMIPEVSLEPFGIDNLFLKLRIRVSNDRFH